MEGVPATHTGDPANAATATPRCCERVRVADVEMLKRFWVCYNEGVFRDVVVSIVLRPGQTTKKASAQGKTPLQLSRCFLSSSFSPATGLINPNSGPTVPSLLLCARTVCSVWGVCSRALAAVDERLSAFLAAFPAPPPEAMSAVVLRTVPQLPALDPVLHLLFYCEDVPSVLRDCSRSFRCPRAGVLRLSGSG